MSLGNAYSSEPPTEKPTCETRPEEGAFGKTGSVDIEGLARDRDQLFAEASKAYNDGEQWWPDKLFEHEHVTPEQEARFEVDAWEESISTYLDNKKGAVTIGQVGREALGIEVPNSAEPSKIE